MGLGRFVLRAMVGLVGLAIVAFLFLGVLGIAVLLLKIAVVVFVLSWIYRAVTGRFRKRQPVLIGAPIAEVAAPRRDKYDLEAERELDRELGI